MDSPFPALASLDSVDRRRVASAVRGLRDAWQDERYLMRIGRALRQLAVARAVIVYRRAPDGTFGDVASSMKGGLRIGWDGLGDTKGRLGAHTRYRPDRRDRLANRTIPTPVLFRGVRDRLGAFREQMLSPFGVWNTARCTVYERDRLLVYCGMFRTRSEREFGARECAMLDALVPAVRDGLVAHQAIGDTPLGAAGLGNVLDAFEEPAFLVTGGGAVLFANRAARTTWPRALPGWLAFGAEGAAHTMLLERARLMRLDVVGRSVWLVLPRPSALPVAAPLARSPFASLSPTLARVAHMIAEGMSDRQIAEALEVTHATARTHVTRLYRRLGIHDRGELMRLARTSPPDR